MAEPRCRYFNRCGGCSAQHVDYSDQLENKKEQLVFATKTDDVKVFSGEPYGYRNRMDFVFHARGIGFREKGKWYKIVDIAECPISNERLNEIAAEIREFFGTEIDAFHVKKHTGTFRYAVVRTPGDQSSVSFVLNSESSRIAEAIELIKKFAETSSVENILVTYVPPNTDTSISEDFFVVKGGEFLESSYMGKKFKYHVQGFFQNNLEISGMMHEYVNDLLKKATGAEPSGRLPMQDISQREPVAANSDADLTGRQGAGNSANNGAELLDLYGGVGTFGIVNASLFDKVHVVEDFPQCIDAAKENVKLNNASNVKCSVLDAKNLEKMSFGKKLFVVTDPPRSGMHPKTIKQLNRLRPEMIVYVSCNINQLAKDVPKFYEYEVRSAALFDFFPQTPHAEGVVELVRKKS